MTSHKFQSITEQQWKSGTPQSRCAECAEDFGHPVHCESSWPLVVVEDCYVPEVAAPLIEGLRGLREETGLLTIRLYTIDADNRLWSQRN